MKLSSEKILYLKKFLNSVKSKSTNLDFYSDYWKYFASEMRVDFKDDNEVIVYGGSKGASIYFNKIILLRNLFYLNSFKKSSSFLLKYLKNKLLQFKNARKIKKLNWAEGFDRVMRNDQLTEHILSEHYVNHLELRAKYKNIYGTSKEVIKDYKKWGSMKITEKMFMHYYNFNLLYPYLSRQDKDFQSTFMDIGGGNGLLASILCSKHKPKNMIIVDLPQTLINSYCYLGNCFTENNIYLPNEFNSKEDLQKIMNKDSSLGTSFYLLSPDQISFIPSNSVDLSINSTSFQEMNFEQIQDYFDLIERVSKNKSLFYCVNRVQKSPHGQESSRYKGKPNIFYEYPWAKKNKLLINEISRLYGVCQYEPVAIRLQEISK